MSIFEAFTQMRTLKMFTLGISGYSPSYEKAKKMQGDDEEFDIEEFNNVKKNFYDELIKIVENREILKHFSSESTKKDYACMIEDHLK